MRAFISYSTALDQIIALRLQTMAAVYGMTIYVPPATTRTDPTGLLSADVKEQLRQSDLVLAVITHSPSPSALAEINTAMALSRLLIPIVGPGVPSEYYGNFPKYFLVDANDPSKAEQEIVQFLAGKQQEEAARTAVLALTTLAVALLLLGSGSK